MADLKGRRIAFVTSNEGVEEAELTGPWEAIKEAGGEPVLIAPSEGEVQCFQHLDRSGGYPVDATTASVKADEFDALVLPGGVANADELRGDEDAVALVGSFFDSGRPVGVICHGPWAIIEADQVRGRTITSWPTLQTDIRNAGGTWVDAEVQVCTNGPNTLVSSRKPDDIPAFNAKLIDAIEQWKTATR